MQTIWWFAYLGCDAQLVRFELEPKSFFMFTFYENKPMSICV